MNHILIISAPPRVTPEATLVFDSSTEAEAFAYEYRHLGEELLFTVVPADTVGDTRHYLKRVAS